MQAVPARRLFTRIDAAEHGLCLRLNRAAVVPLDRYSFPSGHTLHAVCMTLIATSHFPAPGWLLWPS